MTTQPPEPQLVAAPAPLEIRERLAHPSNYALQRSKRFVQCVVLHCTDGHEGYKQGANVARMFQDPNLQPRRSAHYVVDTDSVTLCVPDRSVAWHCGRTGNARGLGIELCGFAKQTRAEWLDGLSLPMLRLAARLVAMKCREFALPTVFINSTALRSGATGITTHAEVTAAWRETTHTDPGPGFPMDLFAAAVANANGN